MATIIDSLLVTLGLDSSQFKAGKSDVDSGLKDTGKKADEAGTKFEDLAKKTAKFLAVIGGTMAIKHFIENQIEANAALYRFSQNLGESANDVSAWSRAAELAGGSSAGLQGTMQSLSQAQTELMLTGQSSLIPYFSALGINMSDAAGKARPVTDILLDMADVFGKMDRTTANNMGRMMGIDQGTLQLLLKGRAEVELMVKRQKEHGAVTQKQAEADARLNRAMIAGRQSFEAFGRSLMSIATPALEGLFRLFSSFSSWVGSNMEFIKTFLTVMAVGLLGIAAATIPIDLVIVAIVALAAAIAALWQDYQTFKRGGQSLIDWNKWGPGIDAAKNGLIALRDLLVDLMIRAVAVGDAIMKLAHGDFSGARLAGKVILSGIEGQGLQSDAGENALGQTIDYLKTLFESTPETIATPLPSLKPIAGATSSARGAGGANVAQAKMAAMPFIGNRSVETNIGEVNVITSATDATGIAKDMAHSLDYLFTSQANSGLN